MSERRPTVAIVDDDPSMLRAVQSLLEAHEFQTLGYTSAEEFLERDAATTIDCLLLDIDLGGLSGIDLRQQLLAAGSSLPVVFMTALDGEAVQREAMAAGCIAYLRKPFPAKQLVEALTKALLPAG